MRVFIVLLSVVVFTIKAQASFVFNPEAAGDPEGSLRAIQLIHIDQFAKADELNKKLDDTKVRLTWVAPTLWDLNLIRVHLRESKSEDLTTYKKLREQQYSFKDSNVLHIGSEEFLDFLAKKNISLDSVENRSTDVFEALVADIKTFTVEEWMQDKFKALVFMDHSVLRDVIDFEYQCYASDLIPLYRSTGALNESYRLGGDQYTCVEARATQYLSRSDDGSCFLGYKGLSYAYSPLSGFLYDGTIGTIGASYNPTPSACSYSYLLEYQRDQLFAAGGLEGAMMSNYMDLTSEELKSKLTWRHLFYAITLPKAKLTSHYQGLFHLPECPFYVGVLGRGELFHPRMKGTYQRKQSLYASEVYQMGLLKGATDPWKNPVKMNVLTLRTLINHFSWMSGAKFFAIDGQIVGPHHQELISKINSDSQRLSRVLRASVVSGKEKEMITEILKTAQRQSF